MIGLQMSFGAEQQQTVRLTPALIALSNMLVLPQADLQQMLEQELAENPALELVEVEEAAICPLCGHRLTHQVCPICSNNDPRSYNEPSAEDANGDVFDPLLLVAAPMRLQEALDRDLRASLDVEDYQIAAYLVGCLDERGFLDTDVESTARTFNCDLERIERVLRKLQEISPTGVGARDVQECLLLQLDQLEREQIVHPYVREIIIHHWEDLSAGRYIVIARALKISQDEVILARDFIRQYLRPYPLDLGSNEGGRSPVAINYVLPDVIIRQEEDHFIIEVVESQNNILRINPLYRDLAAAVRAGTEHVSEQEQEHLRSYISRARIFLNNLRQRRETIRRISEYIVERQEDFLRYGIRHLLPLTRAEVAQAIGVHESTVSRATANKYAQLPNRSVISFDIFFTASLSAKDVLREIIQRENRPLTDSELVKLLENEGVMIARRTVAKYRRQLGILPSNLR